MPHGPIFFVAGTENGQAVSPTGQAELGAQFSPWKKYTKGWLDFMVWLVQDSKL